MFTGNGLPIQPIDCHASILEFHLLGEPSFTQKLDSELHSKRKCKRTKKNDNCCTFWLFPAMAHYSFTAFEWHLCEGDSEWEQTITWQDHHWHVVDFKPSGDGTGSEYVKNWMLTLLLPNLAHSMVVSIRNTFSSSHCLFMQNHKLQFSTL